MPTSAKNGSATWDGAPLSDVTDITVNKDPNIKPYASSSTAGLISRRAGHTDEEGSFVMKVETVPFTEGDSGTLVLKSSVGVTLFTGTAIIGVLSYGVPIEGGDYVEVTVAWGQQPA